MQNLDTILANSTPNQTIQLGAGTYTTNGAVLKSGQELLGMGRGVTVIKLIPDRTRDMTVILGSGSNTVESLTVDGSAEPTEAWSNHKTNGVFLTGDGNTVRDVEAIRTFGNYTTQSEGFSIMVHGPSKFSSITNCQVREVCGSYVSALCLGGRGLIRSCQAIFPEIKADPDKTCFHMGINVGPGKGALVTHNVVVNGTSGFYSDWEDTNGLTVTENDFLNCIHGVLIKMQFIESSSAQDYRNAVFHKNRIELSGSEKEQICGFLFDNTRQHWSNIPICHGAIQNINITENLVSVYDGPAVAAAKYFVNAASLCASPDATHGIQDFTFRDNVHPSNFGWRNFNGQHMRAFNMEKKEIDVAWITT